MFAAFENIKITIYGESHSKEIGVAFEGLPKGLAVSLDDVQNFVDRRKSGVNPWSTPRKEDDKVIVDCGIENGMTTGETVRAHIANTAQRSADYDILKNTPRPSHADYVARIKDGSTSYMAGGGRFSGRMTAPMCIAGSIAKQILEKDGVTIGAYVQQIGDVKGESYREKEVVAQDVKTAQTLPIAVLDGEKKCIEMTDEVLRARADGDSVGGIVECIVFGLPAGFGDALYDGMEGRIAASLFAVPAVKGIEFGTGFGLANMRGSEANDAFAYDKDKRIVTLSNNSGGINGGISNGQNVTLRVAFRPTPSISKPQRTIDLETEENVTVEIKGRHDACIVPRAVPAVEAAVALAVLDCILDE